MSLPQAADLEVLGRLATNESNYLTGLMYAWFDRAREAGWSDDAITGAIGFVQDHHAEVRADLALAAK